MKTRSILPFAVLGILLALLLAVSACDNDEPSDGSPTPNETPVVDGPSGEFSKQVGGPYSFVLRGVEASEKERDFKCYKEMGLSLSQAVILDDKLLRDSIEKNYESPDRTDSQKYDTQKYNFVIDVIAGKKEIIVAKWDVEDIEAALKAATDKAKGENNCGGRKCLEDGGFTPQVSNKEVMVNLFPEDKKADPKQSPCWLDSAKSKGLLDAISKHFMLAQLAQGERSTIADFDENNWYEWTAEKVLYAGEIIVDLESCTLDVNGDSGTYRPKTSYRTLTKVVEQFDDTISIGEISDALCSDGIKVKD